MLKLLIYQEMKSVSKVVKNLDYVVNMGFIWLSADDVSIVAILNLIVAVLQFFLCFFFFLSDVMSV